MKKIIIILSLSLLISGFSHKQKGKRFEKLDQNKDNYISKSEFLKNAENKFIEIDKNKDGKLSKKEMKQHRKSMHKKHHRSKKHRKEKYHKDHRKDRDNKD